MVSIQNLTFAYKKEKQLLSDVNLELKKGKVYGLLGLNGVGKTTLLNLITGMLFPKSGESLLYGENTRFRNPDVLSNLFIVPEQFEFPKITGHKYVDIHASFYPGFNKELMQRVISEFTIDPSKKLPELSFGQRKKFLIAFAIATQTELLIFDEPTNGLDIPSKSQFRKIIATLDVESRCILISTHQVRDLGSMIDHILVLKDGSIVFNHDLESISDRLSMQKIEENSSADYLYGEEMLGGIHAIIPSSKKETGKMDLELLFNGIIQKTEEINQEFNGVVQ
ncbi:MAG: ABC transporter ATP-binding protein [Balneola sp.]